MKLSAYAFNTYGSDARLYNGIHDMEQRIAEVAAEVATLKAENATMCENLPKNMGELYDAVVAALEKDLAVAIIAKYCRLHMKALEAENAALREDKARLVEALEEIADGDGCNCRVGPGCDWKCKDIARNALAKKARAKK